MQQVEIRVRGGVGRVLASALQSDDGLDVRTETVLTGRLADQAELHGLLARLRDLGLELVDVHVASRAD